MIQFLVFITGLVWIKYDSEFDGPECNSLGVVVLITDHLDFKH